MRNLHPGQRGFERKALFLSLLFHLILLKFFVLTFPAKQLEKKPFFIFLGSILTGNEFSRPISKNINDTKAPKQLLVEPTLEQNLFNPNDSSYMGKPIFSKNVPKPQKLFLKSTFLENKPANNETNKSFNQVLGNNLNDFKYIPLSLPEK